MKHFNFVMRFVISGEVKPSSVVPALGENEFERYWTTGPATEVLGSCGSSSNSPGVAQAWSYAPVPVL